MSGRILVSGIMTVVFAVFVGLAFTIHHEAAVMPLLVGVPGLVLSLVQLVIEMRKVAVTADEPIFSPRERSIAIWLLGFVLAIIAFGFDVGATVLVAAYLWLAVGARPLGAAIGGGLCLATMYVLDHLLNIPLFQGLIFHHLF